MGLALQALDIIPEDDLGLRGVLSMQLGVFYLNLGDEDAADRALAQATEMGMAAGGHFAALGGVYVRALIARRHGRLRDSAAICREALESIVKPLERSRRQLPICGVIYLQLGSILLEWNRLGEASHALTKGIELTEILAGMDGLRAEGTVALVRLKLAQGDVGGLPDLNALAEQHWPESVPFVAAHQARVWLIRAEQDPRFLADAFRWAEGQQLELVSDDTGIARSLTLARVLVAQRLSQGRFDLQAVLGYLDEQLPLVVEDDWTGLVIETQIVRALALQAQGDVEQALSALERALTLAEPED